MEDRLTIHPPPKSAGPDEVNRGQTEGRVDNGAVGELTAARADDDKRKSG